MLSNILKGKLYLGQLEVLKYILLSRNTKVIYSQLEMKYMSIFLSSVPTLAFSLFLFTILYFLQKLAATLILSSSFYKKFGLKFTSINKKISDLNMNYLCLNFDQSFAAVIETLL